MSVISLHRKYSFVDYQIRLCSLAAFITLLTIVIAIVLPFIWIFKVNNNNFSPTKDFISYEQPMVKFQFKYIFIAENSMDSERAVFCTSFERLNQLEGESCAKFKVTEKDENFDGIPDLLQLSFEFPTKFRYGVKSVRSAIFLDARIENQCKFRIPSALVINKAFPSNVNDRTIFISGTLQPVQSHTLICPFFLRNIKSHFFFDNLSENSTNLEDFSLTTIQSNLDRNPLSFQFHETSTDTQDENYKTTVIIKVRIPQIAIRYQKTFWQNVNEVWINYIAIFTVTFVIANYALNFLYESRWLMARKKIYLEKSD